MAGTKIDEVKCTFARGEEGLTNDTAKTWLTNNGSTKCGIAVACGSNGTSATSGGNAGGNA